MLDSHGLMKLADVSHHDNSKVQGENRKIGVQGHAVNSY
jgi:hypothetical protein